LLDISDGEFVALRDLIRERFGIWYDDQKRFLLLSRLSTRLAKRGIETYGAYVHFLRYDARREDEWDDQSRRSLAMLLNGDEIPDHTADGHQIRGDTLLVILHSHHLDIEWHLPSGWGDRWEVLIRRTA